MKGYLTIILRRKAPFRRTLAAGPLIAGPLGTETLPTLGEPVLELAELSPEEVADVRQDPEVQSVAEAMPMKLIKPVGDPEQVPTAEVPTAAGNTWGIEAIHAHTSPFTGEGVVVAVLDTGINPNHVAFQGVHLERHNFTQGPDDDENGHGTHCAGTIFGREVDGLRIGVAPGVTKALIGKVCGPGADSSAILATAISWAYEKGANVISMSLGIDFPGYVAILKERDIPEEAAISMALEQYRSTVSLFSTLNLLYAGSNAYSQAAVLVAAAGNESVRPKYVVAVEPPAAGDGVISVGALQRSDSGSLNIAPFSNTQCNLCGPGVGVTSAWNTGNNALLTISGTSMATPHVAGCAALWAQQQKQLTGVLTAQNLAAKTLASAIFVPGSSFQDIGNGMVQTPQN